MTRLLTLLTFLGAFAMSNVQSNGQEASPKQVTHQQAMDYFAGSWRGTGVQGTYEYTGRESAEWDLHHTIMSHRTEFFGKNFAHTLLLIQKWDPQQKKIAEHQFASWGVYRKGAYDVVPHGDWFQLVGVCDQTGDDGTRTAINVITIHDENHYTFAGVPKLGSPGAPMLEDYSREGVASREDRSNRTDEYLQEAIEYLEAQPNANPAEIATLKLALGRFLLYQDKYVDAIEVFEKVLAQQTERLTPEDTDVAKTIDAIVGACRGGAYNLCMDTATNADDLSVALGMATKAAELAPDDQRIWLQAFAHYRLGDNKAAQLAIRDSGSKDDVWAAVLLLAAMIENKSGNTELSRATYMIGAELGDKGQSAEWDKWMAMAQQALGDPPDYAQMDNNARLASYEKAIQVYPSFSHAYRMRGRFYGGLGQWDKALADYRKAAELSPNVLRHREGEAAILLYRGTPEEQNTVCQKLFQQWADSTNPSSRMDMVLMSSLCSDTDIDRLRLTEIADEVLANIETRAFLTVAKGMTLYRLKRYQDVVKTISTEGTVNPKDLLLGQTFLAMAHKQLGHDDRARQILNHARAVAEQQIPTPDGTPLQYQDRPIIWCMVQTAFREAEQLIGGAEDSRLEAAAVQ
ncbi:tetratricopeptide repeat protein [Novipirellula artificiosorum]|uniref:Tetratricopeptide repeat protein n=1 Tax=Novipirellula artificiosorum TaxID=2528016 RepID=A0A5C6CMA3_9BACT|nr:tetratricopeptide repeat protein [Novipirellula artificiosorum]TWU24461.1 Tetratricopeptide repeat protein [Novipirellula artificiosorum]